MRSMVHVPPGARERRVAAYRTESINDSKARMKMPIEGKCMHARHRRQNRAAQLVRFSVVTPPRLGGRASRSTVERLDCSRSVWNSSAWLSFDSQSLAAGSDRALRHRPSRSRPSSKPRATPVPSIRQRAALVPSTQGRGRYDRQEQYASSRRRSPLQKGLETSPKSLDSPSREPKSEPPPSTNTSLC